MIPTYAQTNSWLARDPSRRLPLISYEAADSYISRAAVWIGNVRIRKTQKSVTGKAYGAVLFGLLYHQKP